MKKPLFQNFARQMLVLLFCLILPATILSQSQTALTPGYLNYGDEIDKCGFDEALAAQMAEILGRNWGYGYDSLLADLDRWRQSPYVTIDSLGASVQNRALWQLTITSNLPPGSIPRHTVFIHARTHPGEVQGWWVTNEIINLLLSENPYAQFVRENCTFYIIPMYNPDGVELGYPRQNANGIDLESNWNANPVEPEVAVLRNRFTELMSSSAPIETALNMHSAYICKRYFVYHDSAGTSYQFTLLEKDFINGVRYYFPNGIEPWSFFISWTSGTPLVYPESWFWLNFGEAVMALTYEDMNCASAGAYDSTAYALLHGVTDYLGLVSGLALDRSSGVDHFTLNQNYPNPFNPKTTIEYELPYPTEIQIKLYDALGRVAKAIYSGRQKQGIHFIELDGSSLSSGVYYYQLSAKNFIKIKKCILLK